MEQVAGKSRCVMRGDIAELALKDGEEEPWTQDGAFKLAASYKAPMGYRFKQLNDAATEAMCDVSGEFRVNSADGRYRGQALCRSTGS